MAERVMLIRNTWPKMYGGGETYQLMLAQKLKENGFEPIIVTSSEGLLAAAKGMGFETVKAPFNKRQNWSGLGNLFYPVYAAWQRHLRAWYRKIFLKYEPVAINVQSRDDWLAATKAARRLKIRVIWTDHADFRNWALKNVNVPLKNHIGKQIVKMMKKADTVIMISDAERQWLEKKLKRKTPRNLVTIKNGVPDRLSEYMAVQPEPQTFLYLGRVVESKGIGELLEGFIKVIFKYPDATLKIYGRGEDLEKFQEKAKGLKQVQFMGMTTDPLRVIAENTIFVLPSYREGLSLSLLEAAMMGKQIIASNIEGNQEVVQDGENGILVEPKNAAELGNAMIWALDHPNEMGRRAAKMRADFQQNYDFGATFSAEMLPLYMGAAQKKQEQEEKKQKQGKAPDGAEGTHNKEDAEMNSEEASNVEE